MVALAAAPIGVETLDSPGADPVLVRRMLADIARANRWLGGVSAMEHGLTFLCGTIPPSTSLSLLDVGTGAGDLPLAARKWARRRGMVLGAVGLERHTAAAALSRENGVPSVVGCGSALPFRSSATIDVVLISQLLHHFDDTAATALIAEAARVARIGVILTDLRPMPGAALGFRVAGTLLRFHRTTIDDGIVSIARGRPARALAQLAAQAGAERIMARDLPLARVVVAFRSRA